jgi:RNA polymerase sigma-32 factor
VKGQIQALEDGELKPEQVKRRSPQKLGVSEEDVVSMNRRLSAATPR